VHLWKYNILCSLFTVAVLCLAPDCKCQNEVKNIELQTFAGFVQFDKSLSFDSSPFFGLGAGYDIRKYLQFNLNVYFSPTRQHIRTATSELTTNVSMYQYQFNIKFQSQQRFFNLVTPFMQTGAGGIIFNPEKTTLDTGGGSFLEFNPNSEHKSQLHFGGGFVQTLTQKLKLLFQYEVVLFHSEKLKVDGISTKNIIAKNSIWGINFTYHF